MRKIIFTDEETFDIIRSYTNRTKTMRELAGLYNCSWATIYRLLAEKQVNIKRTFKKRNLSGQKFGKLLVLEMNTERYNKDLLKSKKPHIYWKCTCDCGNYTEVESSHLLNGHTTSCGCIKSLGEQKISQLLSLYNIPFVKEFYFDDLRGCSNRLLRFDFAIIKDNKICYLIEFNGEQHYRKANGWDKNEEFTIRQYNDKQKNTILFKK